KANGKIFPRFEPKDPSVKFLCQLQPFETYRVDNVNSKMLSSKSANMTNDHPGRRRLPGSRGTGKQKACAKPSDVHHFALRAGERSDPKLAVGFIMGAPTSRTFIGYGRQPVRNIVVCAG